MGILLEDVSFHYPNQPVILKGVNLSISSGTFLGITGVNGSGKSTFSYVLNGLIPHSVPGTLSGVVTVDGISTRDNNVPYFSRVVGMVFQNPDFSLFNLTVEEEIAFGLKQLDIEPILKIVGLSGFSKRDPQSLSYGQKQKVCLACVLARDVPYLVLDEPTSMLDYRSSVQLYELLRRLNRKGKTIITIEHDTDYLWKYTKETMILKNGTVALYGKTHNVLSDGVQLKKLFVKPPNTLDI